MQDSPRTRILHRANLEYRRGRGHNKVLLTILAGEKIVEHGPEVVHGPGDLR
jgi:hypothetical protein